MGADAFASDLNPVAVLLNKVVLEYIPKYGNAELRMQNAEGEEVVFQGLAEAVRYWGNWIKEEAEKELGRFYPADPDGSTPIAYLWARTIISEAPDDGTGIPVEVPLMRSLWLAKKRGRNKALRWVRDGQGRVQTETVDVTYADGVTRTVRRPLLELFVPKKASEVGKGTVNRGNATCPVIGFTTPVASVRRQLKARRGGADDARLLVVVTTQNSNQGRSYRTPLSADLQAVVSAGVELDRRKSIHTGIMSLVPDEPVDVRGIRHTWGMIYGLDQWGFVFTTRQQLALVVLTELVRNLPFNFGSDLEDIGFPLQSILALACNRLADYNSSLSRWVATGEFLGNTYTRQALPIVWDFAEVFPMSEKTGGFSGAVEWIAKAIHSTLAIMRW